MIVQSITPLSRTQPLRPSKIGLFCYCPLRYVYETERPDPGGLPSGPQVYLGIAFHNAIENFWGQTSIKGTEIREWIRSEFGKKVALEDKGLCKWLYCREGIDGLIAPSLVSDASRLAQQQVAASEPDALLTTLHHTCNTQSILGVERRLISNELDLAGRADLIEQQGDSICIVDFKLGLALDELGQPKHEYLLQLAAYALIVRQQMGGNDFVLELRSPRKIYRNNFDTLLEGEILNVIEKMQVVLPRMKALEQSALANEGEHCLSCGYRFMCSNYLNRLSSNNLNDAKFISTQDVQGQVISVTRNNDFVSVLLSAKPDSRRVHISGIPITLLEAEIKPGDELSALSLRTPEALGKGNYIANFHVFNEVNPRQSAFSSKFLLNKKLS
jgi:CRISPR/Cas system-associated exonuclease Cas4 (RecB family)